MNAKLLVCASIAIVLVACDRAQRLPAPQRSADLGIVAVEFDDRDLHAYRSLRAYGPRFTHLLPRWLHLAASGRQLDNGTDPDIVEDATKLGLAVIPILDNVDASGPRPDLARAVLTDPTRRGNVILAVSRVLADNNLAGVEVQFLGLEAEDSPAVATFLRELRDALQPSGRVVVLSAAVAGAQAVPAESLAEVAPRVDDVRVRIYDQHSAATEPGPPATTEFFTERLEAALRVVPREKLIAGMSVVGYDWPEGGTAEELAYSRAMALAAVRGGTIDWDQAAGGLRLTYEDQGTRHQAYFEDALTLSNKLAQVEARRLAGVSFYRLGMEDPTFWARLTDGPRPEALQRLSTVPDTLYFQVLGAGEVWDVVGEKHPGQRQFTVDPATGQIADIRYADPPSPYVLQRSGAPADGKKVALTFDDGPDPDWTPTVLDILARYHVPATFFYIGRHALANPDLVRRAYREGHEIGNHTLTHSGLGDGSALRATFELNATRYIVASIIGRTMRYARSPFVANPDPREEDSSLEPGSFLVPLVRAHDNGYLTVGNRLDPRDWTQPGTRRIVETTTNRQLTPPGYIILMHDSGGDRRQTLAALPAVIEFYQAQGYEFTTISGLLGKDREYGMPPMRPDDAFAVQFVGTWFQVFHVVENTLLFLMFLSIGIGVVRVVGMLVLAIIHYLQPRVRPFDARELQPFVSILVPAYNEEKVIGNTIESLLKSNYRNYEIIVLDDGSKDNTVAVARRYESNPRVRVIAKENGGKSSALNLGIQLARGEVVIAMDADTVFEPDFIPYILGHFRDPNVGAASGNAKVGNREDLIANWQSIEYITSFNLDRRAYTLLNCVTVVPGAAGAWRKRDLVAAGGFGHDTLAEDADLTVNVRRLGRRIVYEDRAIAWTEAPNSVRAFVKQRRRWSYGTLQMLWKQRDAFFRPKYGALGFVAFPSTLLYLAFSVIAPAVDLGAIYAVISQVLEQVQLNEELPMTQLEMVGSLLWSGGPRPLLYYLAFIGIEWIQSAIAFYMDRERPAPLLWVPIQRFALRWLLYYVLFATFIMAIKGFRVGWGKLERKGSVLGPRGAPRA